MTEYINQPIIDTKESLALSQAVSEELSDVLEILEEQSFNVPMFPVGVLSDIYLDLNAASEPAVRPEDDLPIGQLVKKELKNHLFCQADSCMILASFNFPGLKKRFCYSHKEPGMINVIKKKCDRYDRYMAFTMKGNKAVKFCGNHAKPGMTDNRKHKACRIIGCRKHAVYNRPGRSPVLCNDHKKEGMVDVRPKCGESGCKLLARLGEPTYCLSLCRKHYQELTEQKN